MLTSTAINVLYKIGDGEICIYGIMTKASIMVSKIKPERFQVPCR